MDITYKLVPINVEAEKLEDAVFPELKDRKIEKQGQPIFFSIKDIEDNMAINAKIRKETEAKLELELAKKENIEHFHHFVKDLTPEQLFTAHMYKESSAWVDISNKKLADLDRQDKIDLDEIEEIKKQIPEIAKELEKEAPIESPYVEIVNEEEEESENEE